MTTAYIPKVHNDTTTMTTSTSDIMEVTLELMNYKFEPKPIPLLISWDMGKCLYSIDPKEEDERDKLMKYKKDSECRYRNSISKFMSQMGKW